MRSKVRVLSIAIAAIALVGAVAGLVGRPVDAGTPRVLISDNDSKIGQAGFDAGAGWWGFSPSHIEVWKGEKITFDNPAGNFRNHDVVSMERDGGPYDARLIAGAKFNSSPSADAVIKPGMKFELDTTDATPGHYTYYCSLHPWMVGSITVMEPPAPPAPAS